MTKLVTVRVTVATDDDAPLGDVQTRLRAIIEERGTERLPAGADQPDGVSPRVHWATADVMRDVDRGNVRQAVRKPSTPRLAGV